METVNKFVSEISYKIRISMFSVSAANLPENAEVIKALEYANVCDKWAWTIKTLRQKLS